MSTEEHSPGGLSFRLSHTTPHTTHIHTHNLSPILNFHYTCETPLEHRRIRVCLSDPVAQQIMTTAMVTCRCPLPYLLGVLLLGVPGRPTRLARNGMSLAQPSPAQPGKSCTCWCLEGAWHLPRRGPSLPDSEQRPGRQVTDGKKEATCCQEVSSPSAGPAGATSAREDEKTPLPFSPSNFFKY